jgi:hypothetical protein
MIVDTLAELDWPGTTRSSTRPSTPSPQARSPKALELLAASPDPDRRELRVGILGEAGRAALPDLRSLARRPEDSADHWLLLGSALVAAAGAARGADLAENTSAEQIGGMLEPSRQARSALRRAAELAPGDATPWKSLMTCALAAPEHDECGELFEQACRRAPALSEVHGIRLLSLTRKWGGSGPEMFAFARDRTAWLPRGHPLIALIAVAHVESYVDAS